MCVVFSHIDSFVVVVCCCLLLLFVVVVEMCFLSFFFLLQKGSVVFDTPEELKKGVAALSVGFTEGKGGVGQMLNGFVKEKKKGEKGGEKGEKEEEEEEEGDINHHRSVVLNLVVDFGMTYEELLAEKKDEEEDKEEADKEGKEGKEGYEGKEGNEGKERNEGKEGKEEEEEEEGREPLPPPPPPQITPRMKVLQYMETPPSNMEEPWGRWRRDATAAMMVLHSITMKKQPVIFICQIEIMLPKYNEISIQKKILIDIKNAETDIKLYRTFTNHAYKNKIQKYHKYEQKLMKCPEDSEEESSSMHGTKTTEEEDCTWSKEIDRTLEETKEHVEAGFESALFNVKEIFFFF